MTVYCALTGGYVKIFDADWKQIPSKQLTILKTLENLMDPIQNYKKYCDMMKEVEPPSLPFQGILISFSC